MELSGEINRESEIETWVRVLEKGALQPHNLRSPGPDDRGASAVPSGLHLTHCQHRMVGQLDYLHRA